MCKERWENAIQFLEFDNIRNYELSNAFDKWKDIHHYNQNEENCRFSFLKDKRQGKHKEDLKARKQE